jgi:PAS domain S-box-containing protein/diguanylate cyclase (GGDEF)-like protein
MKPITEIILAQLCKLLPNRAMTSYMKSIMSINDFSSQHTGNAQAIVKEWLYPATLAFSVDRAGLWLFNQEENAYQCSADIFKGVIFGDDMPLITQENDLSLFSFIHKTTGIIVNNKADQYSSLVDIGNLLSTLELHSILLMPLRTKDNNRGFVFLGNSTQVTHWSDAAVLSCQLLSQLIHNTLITTDISNLQEKLQQQNQLMLEMEKKVKISGWDYEISTGKLTWTEDAYRIYGLSHSDAISTERRIESYSPDAQKKINTTFNSLINNLEPYAVELPLIDINDEHKCVRTTGRIRYSRQMATHIYGTFEDVTERNNILASEKSISTYLKGIVDNIDDCIISMFENGTIFSINDEVKKVFGYSENELIGKNLSKIIPDILSKIPGKYIINNVQHPNGEIIGGDRELSAIKRDGTAFPIQLSINEVLNENEYVCIVRNISDKKKEEQKTHELAYYDEKTSALNRYSFERDLKKLFEKSILLKEKTCLFLLDIDNFSQINLIYGQSIGDDVLRVIAIKLMNNLPFYTQVYKNNADTFYILLEINYKNENSKKSHEDLAKEILKIVNQTIYLEYKIINIKMSIGILHFYSKDIDYIDIKPLLELAVINAKKQGGNRYLFAVRNESEILKRQSELSQAMMSDHFKNELSLVLQPQFSIDGMIVGSESLVRWKSSILGHVSPKEFIPLAEKNGAIISLGDWVIDKTCLLLSQRKMLSTESSPISINISVKQIVQPLFCDKLLAKLDQYKIPYSELMLELTEHVLITDFNLVISKMKNLKNKGINFSIDDFGTGYSSLSYIHKLPISELKIDKIFVDNIKNSIDEVPIINTIIKLAKSLDLKIVAEGVEYKEQFEYLKKHECDVIQGYYFSKPISPKEWLNNWAVYSHIKSLF